MYGCRERLHYNLVKNGFRDKTSSLEEHEYKLHPDVPLEQYQTPATHAEKAATRTESRYLTKFIKLSDQLLGDSLITLTKTRLSELLEQVNTIENIDEAGEKKVESEGKMKKISKKKKQACLFTLELKLNDMNELEFFPELADFQEVLERSIFDVIKV
eukprot:UN33322